MYIAIILKHFLLIQYKFQAGLELGWYNLQVMKYVQLAKNQPKIIEAFRRSLATLSGNIYLLLFPILLDLFFLFGKRILVSNIISSWINAIVFPPSTSPELLESWSTLSQQYLKMIADFSLTGFLRSYPIGVPSLLAFRPMAVNPSGAFASIQTQSSIEMFLWLVLFSLIGFVLGAFYLLQIGNAAQGKHFKDIFRNFVNKLANLFTIPVISAITFMVIFLPAVFIISIIANLVPFFGNVGYFLLTLFLINRITPVIFSAHDIILYENPIVTAVKESIRTVRPTNSKTSFFILIAFLFSIGTNYLWQIPTDNSWMLLVSIFGHALVTTLIFIASFQFYIDARQCVLESTLYESEQAQSMN